MKRKYYAAGKEISQEEVTEILLGNHPKGVSLDCLAVLTDYLEVEGNELKKDDPLLELALEKIRLPLEETFIVQNFYDGDEDPLMQGRRVEIYAYREWGKAKNLAEITKYKTNQS